MVNKMGKKKKEVSVMECPFRHLVMEQGQSFDVIKMGDWFHVRCNICGAISPSGETEEEAVRMHNNRDIAVISDEAYKLLMKAKEQLNESDRSN
jgi:hypothetical protein